MSRASTFLILINQCLAASIILFLTENTKLAKTNDENEFFAKMNNKTGAGVAEENSIYESNFDRNLISKP